MPLSQSLLLVSGSPALAIMVKASVVAGLALAGTALQRRSRAAVRHIVLAAAFAILLLIPLAEFAGPQWRVGLRMPAPAVAQSGGAIATTQLAKLSQAAEAAPPASGVSLATLLAGVWGIGALLALLPLLLGAIRLRCLRRSAIPWTEARPVIAKLAAASGVRRPVDVLLHESLPGPITCGLRRPAIVLPSDAPQWGQDDLNRALVHELEHIRRADWLTGACARIACALYWFHPLVWIALQKLVLEAERACDDAVLAGSEPAAYADQLVALARRAKAAKLLLPAMASRADLGARIGAVLDEQQPRGRAQRRAVVLTGMAAAASLLAIAPLRMVASPQEPGTAAGAAPTFTSTTRLVVVPVTVTYSNGQPVEGLRPGDFTISEDGRKQTIALFEPTVPGAQPSQYVLGYYTPNTSADGAFHQIKVAAAVPSASVRCRVGYYGDINTLATVIPARQTTEKPDPNNRQPIPLSRTEAQYSEAARKAKWQGSVLLNAEVTPTGGVSKVTVGKSLGLGLDEKAIESVTQWKFLPAMKDGKPVGAAVQVEVNFRLP